MTNSRLDYIRDGKLVQEGVSGQVYQHPSRNAAKRHSRFRQQLGDVVRRGKIHVAPGGVKEGPKISRAELGHNTKQKPARRKR